MKLPERIVLDPVPGRFPAHYTLKVLSSFSGLQTVTRFLPPDLEAYMALSALSKTFSSVVLSLPS